MAKRKAGNKKTKQAGNGENGGIVSLTKELFQAAITLRGSVEPADYKRYVLPIIFLRFLLLRYDRRRAELEALVADKKSDYFGDKKAIHDPDEYRRVGAFVIPEAARWENLRKAAQADDIKVRLDDVLESLETKYPDKLKGLLPRIYAGSNLDAVSVRGFINLFRELLEKTLQRYHNRLIDAATVVAEMLRMKQEINASDARARELGLTEEEVAFYDTVAENAESVYDEKFLRGLLHDVVQTIKRNLKVDWTEPHRDQVRAEIRAAVRRVLRRRGVREADFEPFIARFIQQAEAQYAEWPLVA